MSLEDFKNNKEYIVPGKNIHWKITSKFINLEVIINWQEYENDKSILPPNELGVSKDWYFEVNECSNTAKFQGKWEIRRIKENLKCFDNVNKKIATIATDRINQ